VERFEQQTIKLCDVGASHYAWFTLHVSESMVAAMKLSTLRPLHGGGRGAPLRVQSNSHLLQRRLAGESILAQNRSAGGEGYRWFEVVQWHTLAVAVAECYYVCNAAALMTRLWPLVEVSFDQYSNFIVDYRHGMLWRPMEKFRS
jgi:hypothetical protein